MVVNSAILHLKIRDDCLTPASQTPVLGWWGDASRHPPGSATGQHMQQPEILMKSRLKNMESLFFRLPKSFRPSACARLGLIQLGQCL